jgi:DNA-binding NarL/FixJ family response regulator
MIRIVLIHDHMPLGESVGLLEAASDVRLLGAFTDGAAAVRSAALEAPDVAVIDLATPRTGAIDMTRRLRAVSPKTPIVMLCANARSESVRQAFWAGASAYVLKAAADEELLAAVRAVHAGERYLSRRIPAAVLEQQLNGDPLERLSAREREVLKLVVEGNTSHQMATLLGLSPKSIDTYRSRLMTKLDVEHLPGLVKFAIRRGLTSA